jgi:hypothetical protein
MTLQEICRQDTEDPTQLRQAYAETLGETISQVGADTVEKETSVSVDHASRITDGDVGELRFQQAAEIMAVNGPVEADTIIDEIRDDLLMGMATAVLDVDTIAASTDLDLTGQEVQQALEGRARMTMAELAIIQAFIASRK